MRTSFAAASAAALSILFAAPALAVPVYGLLVERDLNSPALVKFDSTTPGVANNPIALSGIVAGQSIRAIDFRPANGLLYAVSSTGAASDGSPGSGGGTAAQLYTVNLATGALTKVGAGFTIAGNTSREVSIDFNPVVDRVRVVTGTGQNVRVNPDSGLLAAADTAISDSPNGTSIAAVAYTNNFAGATSTTLYAYDFLTDELDTIGSIGGTPTSPNSGQRFVVGLTNLFSNAADIGLDIDATGAAFASVYDAGLGNYGFYSVNLLTGGFTLIGAEAFALLDFSVQSTAPAAVPEPDSIALVGLGLAGLAFTLRRRARRAA